MPAPCPGTHTPPKVPLPYIQRWLCLVAQPHRDVAGILPGGCCHICYQRTVPSSPELAGTWRDRVLALPPAYRSHCLTLSGPACLGKSACKADSFRPCTCLRVQATWRGGRGEVARGPHCSRSSHCPRDCRTPKSANRGFLRRPHRLQV